MFHRKDAILAAIAGVLATCGFAMADDIQAPKLSLAPTVTADDAAAAPEGLLQQQIDKVGAGSAFKQAGLSVSGFLEAGYTYNHRKHTSDEPILPGPFNHEVGNHFMMNQLDLQIARTVATDKFDVGGLVEVIYGTDAAFTHSSGMGFNGHDPTTDNDPAETGVGDTYRANYQFDVLQAYLTINVPVGNGLKITAGKFVSLLGAETINPTGNLFYSHSWAFSAVNYTDTGILGTYKVNDMLTVTAGVTRGWDMSLEDTNGAIDATGSFAITPMKNVNVALNWSVGPENFDDSSHYRTVIDPVVWWQMTDAFKLGFEGIYEYDGGRQGFAPTLSHAYGDYWGGVVYASYMINDYVTLNGRFEKAHIYLTPSNTNIYDVTAGVTITPFPKDPIGSNLMIRPEVRYDYCEDKIFSIGSGAFHDQLTFAADVIFKF
jgi:hypothetical protein